MNFADEFVVNDPLTFLYFIEGEFDANIFRFENHSCSLFSPISVCLNCFEIVCLGHVGDRLKFYALVEFFSCVWAQLKFSVLISVFGVFRGNTVRSCALSFFFCLSLSDLSEIDSYCEVCGVGYLFTLH